MNNPPFAIGQKVVCVNPNGSLVRSKTYTISDCVACPDCGEWQVGLLELPCGIDLCSCPCNCHSINYPSSPHSHAFSYRFAPIITNYSDATAEILEKFKSPNETPDRIIIPEKVLNS